MAVEPPHTLLVQSLLQHSADDVQIAPSALQLGMTHVPLDAQLPLQQSLAVAQEPPAATQLAEDELGDPRPRQALAPPSPTGVAPLLPAAQRRTSTDARTRKPRFMGERMRVWIATDVP
jgi:hypothetical protein